MIAAERSANHVARLIAGAKYHRREMERRKKEIREYANKACCCIHEFVCGPCLARREMSRGSQA